MERRAALASVGTVLSVKIAGCLFNKSKPKFTLRDIQSYLADSGVAIVTATVEKQGNTEDNVTIRAELLIEDAYNHVSTQTFTIAEDLNERVVALPFTSDSSFYEEHTFTARGMILRQDEADSEWVTEDK